MLKVMTVDDEPDILSVMKILLEREGYKADGALSGRGGLKKIKAESPDVILLDVKLPDINGWEVCRKIKEDPKTSSISVIMFTNKSSKEDMAKSFEYAGAEWHLSRPFKNETLIDILKCVDEDPQDIMGKIEKAVEKGKRRKEVLKTLNPKILNYMHDF